MISSAVLKRPDEGKVKQVVQFRKSSTFCAATIIRFHRLICLSIIC